MGRLTSWPLAATTGVLLLACSRITEAHTRQYKLQHSFGIGEPFTDRGVVDITVEADGVLRARIPTPTSGDAKPLMLEGDAVQHLEAAAKGGKLYRIRAVPEGKNTQPIMTTVRACDLVRSNFRENITLTVNADGSLISLEYTPRMSRLAPKTCATTKLPERVTFSSAVDVSVDHPGQSVPLQAPGPIPPGIRIRLDEHEAPPPPPKGFLQKYWIFIVLAYLLLNSGAAGGGEEEPPRGGAQQGAQGGQPARGGAPAAQAGGAARRPAARRN